MREVGEMGAAGGWKRLIRTESIFLSSFKPLYFFPHLPLDWIVLLKTLEHVALTANTFLSTSHEAKRRVSQNGFVRRNLTHSERHISTR